MITPAGPQISVAIREIQRPLVLMFAFDVVVMMAYVFAGWQWIALPHLSISTFGATMGVVLSFRNTSTYQRWWEARTLWGSIVNHSRILARQVATMILPPGERGGDESCLAGIRRQLVYHQIGYVYALKCHLRGQEPWAELEPFFDQRDIASLARERNIPMEIQRRMGRLLEDCFQRGWLDSMRWNALDATLTALANAQGGSERIKNTPFPRQYDYFQQLFIVIYCTLLPLAMVASLGVLTPIGSTLAGFILMLLDRVGRDLEEPFGNTIHDVPLTAICRTIEINLRQQLGEESLPASEDAVRGVLW
jgi:ion channel-forming bestrophin family protein